MGKEKAPKAAKDPNAPKRPLGAYMLFSKVSTRAQPGASQTHAARCACLTHALARPRAPVHRTCARLCRRRTRACRSGRLASSWAPSGRRLTRRPRRWVPSRLPEYQGVQVYPLRLRRGASPPVWVPVRACPGAQTGPSPPAWHPHSPACTRCRFARRCGTRAGGWLAGEGGRIDAQETLAVPTAQGPGWAGLCPSHAVTPCPCTSTEVR